MVTRIRREFVLSGEDNLDTLVVRANMEGYPFVIKDNRVYQIKSNNKMTRIRHYDVTKDIIIL